MELADRIDKQVRQLPKQTQKKVLDHVESLLRGTVHEPTVHEPTDDAPPSDSPPSEAMRRGMENDGLGEPKYIRKDTIIPFHS
jgi:hypothetical protein